MNGFVASPPNDVLLGVATRHGRPNGRLLDIGCGAGRNAIPLAHLGWDVVGTDLSSAMLAAAARQRADAALSDRIGLVQTGMDSLPFAPRSFDFVIAHGIWNLARSGDEFRLAVREAARVARPGATLFLFTFSRHTLDDDAVPVRGESFVFTQFSGQPQCFLTEDQLVAELSAAGLHPDPTVPMRELNHRPGQPRTGGPPVIYEGVFRFGGD